MQVLWGLIKIRVYHNHFTLDYINLYIGRKIIQCTCNTHKRDKANMLVLKVFRFFMILQQSCLVTINVSEEALKIGIKAP